VSRTRLAKLKTSSINWQYLRMKAEVKDSHFERTALADLWRRTLSTIPSIYGRLVYLNALRTESGAYQHQGFVQVYGMQAAQTALLASHEQAFSSWLGFNLEQQKADLDLYLAGIVPDREGVIEIWLKLAPYRNLVPATARDSERRLFMAEFGALLELLRREHRLSRPDPER
jgi:hypothetical protein